MRSLGGTVAFVSFAVADFVGEGVVTVFEAGLPCELGGTRRVDVGDVDGLSAEEGEVM